MSSISHRSFGPVSTIHIYFPLMTKPFLNMYISVYTCTSSNWYACFSHDPCGYSDWFIRLLLATVYSVHHAKYCWILPQPPIYLCACVMINYYAHRIAITRSREVSLPIVTFIVSCIIVICCRLSV